METIVLASSDPEFLEVLEVHVPATLRKSATLTKMVIGESFVDFLRYEIPDLLILHAPEDPSQVARLFAQWEEDPWLDSVGIILVLPDVEDQIEAFHGFNIAYFLNEGDVSRNLAKVIRILDEKRDFLNYDSIIKKITVLSGELVLETDLLLVQYYSSLFSNYLFKEGSIDRGKKYGVKLALEELLTNAMEHGNAGLSFDDKTQLQEERRSIQDVLEQRMSQAPWHGRKVVLKYQIAPFSSTFTITDEGDGFDTSQLPSSDDVASVDLAHGRGVYLSRASSDHLRYNSKGNEVTVEFQHNGSAERVVPPGFTNQLPREFSPGDVVFWEHTTGDHIYYIVSGVYDVFVNGKKIARLTPSDVFMGEMSFLLGNRRTATVITSGTGKLVEISRQAFTDAVKKYPQYGIFLSKMLARRLRDQNRQYAS